MGQHDDTAKEWGALISRSLVPSVINYEFKINSRTVQGGRTGARACHENVTSKGGTPTVEESQGGRTVNVAFGLVGRPGQVEVPSESRADVSAH